MVVIALVYSIAVLVWVIICLVSGNSQFGGTGSLAAYITFILDQVSPSAPWTIYIISDVCLQMITALGEPAPPLVPWRKTAKLFIDCYKYRMLRLKQSL
jgi:hypothetical protein